jgi:hypothetical protein
MHGTNPSVWIEAFLLRYNVGYVKYLSVSYGTLFMRYIMGNVILDRGTSLIY